MTVTVTHTRVTGAAANPDVLVDGPAWDAAHTVTGLAASATIDTTNADNIGSGTLSTDRLPAVNSNVGMFGSGSTVPVITANAKGLLTSVSTVAIREIVAANRLYVVAATGNDGNTGRAVSTAAVTFTNGSANIGWTAHGRTAGDVVAFTTTGSLPTNFAASPDVYYVKAVVDANTVTVSSANGGTAITAGSAGSGTHTVTLFAPFLTLQRAYDWICNSLDIQAGIIAYVTVASGSYSAGIQAKGRHVGEGLLVFRGNYLAPQNITVTSTSTDGTFTWQNGADYHVKDMQVSSSVQHGFYAKWGGVAHYNNILFGACVNGHKTTSFLGGMVNDAEDGGETRKLSYVGDAVYNNYGHGFFREEGSAITFVGSRTGTSYVNLVAATGGLNYFGSTYAGTFIGKKFSILDGIIQGDQNLAYLPGTVSGTADGAGGYFGTEVLRGSHIAGRTSGSADSRLLINDHTAFTPDAPNIGTPQAHFIAADGAIGGAIFDTYANQGFFGCRRAGGTLASKTDTPGAVTIFTLGGSSYVTGGSGWASVCAVDLVTVNTQTSSDRSGRVRTRVCPSGSATLTEVHNIWASGGVSIGGGLTDPGAGNLKLLNTLFLGVFTVGTAPSGVTAGNTAYFTNLRVYNGAGTLEGAGVGTGGMGQYNGTAWKVVGTNQTISA